MSNPKYNLIEIENAVPIKAWTKGVKLEDEAKKQLLNVAQLPFVHKWVAAMPDVHWGIGATVGSVIPTKGAIIPAAVGVDIGCFTGDTLVPLLDGKSYPIRELAESGKEVVVYSCTESGKVVAAKALARKTRSQAPLVKVILDNGQEIRCTPDHRFMLRDGSYEEAARLSPGVSLMPLYRQLDPEGYMRVKQNYSGRWQRGHWMVARAGLLGPIPRFKDQKTIIHHKNFDEADNSPENLQFMGDADHSAYHRNLVERNQHWQSPEFEEKRKRALSEKAQTEEGRQYFAERGTLNILRYMEEQPEHFKESVAGNGQRGKAYLIAYNQSERGRQKSKEIAHRLYTCETCGEKVRSGLGIHNHRRWVHGYNHKVVAVIPLEEREDVYCLTAPEYHNFALEAGVFVHNCGMMAVQTTLNANHLPDNLRNIRRAIEKAVPHGRTDHGGRRDKGAWGEIPRRQIGVWRQLEIGYKAIVEKYPKLDRGNHVNHLGTLGTGNHFIELCLDENDQVWFMLHSGSRGVGNRIGTFFIEMAKNDMRAHIKNLPDKDLAYFNEGTEHFDDYVEAVHWAQEFAMYNRKLMMEQIVDAVADSGEVPEFELTETAVNCHHNYCIPASEIIPTPSGPKTITELKPGDSVYSFDPQQGLVETRVVRWMASGKKRIFTIRTKHRQIRVSDDHPLLVIQVEMGAHPDRPWHLKGSGDYVWKRASDLRVGDILVCAQGYYSSTYRSLNNGLARFIGAFLGDGWIRQQTASGYTVGLAIGNREELVTQRYARLLADELFPEAHWFNNVPGAFGLTCSSKAVHTAVRDLELGYSSADRYLPNYCFSLPLEEKKALLAGYLDADGCITHSAGRFSSRSGKLIEGLRELAISCGFICTNVSVTTRRSNFGENILYTFYIGSASLGELELWHEAKSARIKLPTKIIAGLPPEKIGYLELPPAFFAERIREIDASDQEEAVYDIEVDNGNHSFICAGVVVHNCAREEHYGEEVFITRKGAVRARKGDWGIIPGSMGARSYIVRGLGNPESFMSCSHGAGRAMSRNEAKRRFTTADHEKATAGIECRKDEDVIDETPAAYKPIEQVMSAQSDLVEIAHTLRQVVCVKG